MHPRPGNWMAIGCAIMYSAWSAHAFSAGIKCRDCICTSHSIGRVSIYVFYVYEIKKNALEPQYRVSTLKIGKT